MKSVCKLAALLSSLCLLSACASGGTGTPSTTPTAATKGDSAATTPIAAIPFVLHFTDREGKPLAGAEVHYAYLEIARQEDMDEITFEAGITDQNGRVETQWDTFDWCKVAFFVSGKDNDHSGRIDCLVTREDIQNGMTLSLKDANS